jgi:4-amino-4-deoxy-L-arabinose transferase-like glycosyltransferase
MRTIKNKPMGAAVVLFVAALLPRIFGLQQFIITDEPTLIFSAGSNVISALLRGDFKNTYWHFYPGLAMSWLDTIGFFFGWLWQLITGGSQGFLEYIYSPILALLTAVRLPYVFLAVFFIIAFYAMSRRLISGPTPFLAAILLAWEPFFIAHSKVVHGDAPVTVFLTLSVLGLLLYGKERHGRLLVFSAFMGGMAALTKAPGQLIAVVVAVYCAGIGITTWHSKKQHPEKDKALPNGWLMLLLWAVIAMVTFVVFFPAMWVDPVGTLRRMLEETFGKINSGHMIFFMGEPTSDPGFWFYPYVIPLRLSPLTLLGFQIGRAHV